LTVKAVHHRQVDSLDCAPTCLLIAAKMLSLSASRAQIEHAFGHERGAASMLTLTRAAQALGLEAFAVHYAASEIGSETPVPFIAHWRGRHFVVVYRVTADRVWVSDPAAPRVSVLSRADFIGAWAADAEKGVALFLGLPASSPSTAFESLPDVAKSQGSVSLGREYLPILGPHLLQIALLSIAGLALGVALPFLAQTLIDEGLGRSDRSLVIIVVCAQTVVMFGVIAAEGLRRYVTAVAATKAYLVLVSNFFADLLAMPLRFFERRTLGDVMGRLEDHRRIERFLSANLIDAIFGLGYLLVIITLATIFAGWIGLVLLGGALLFMSWVLGFAHWRAILDHRRFEQDASIRGMEVRAIEAIVDLKVTATETERRWAWQSAQDELNESTLAIARVQEWQDTGAKVIQQLTVLIVTVAVAWQAIGGASSIGTFVAVTLLVAQLSLPLVQLSNFARNYQDFEISRTRIAAVYDEGGAETIEDRPVQRPLRDAGGVELHLRSIFFDYGSRSGSPIIQSVDLDVPPGTSIAIVGRSGCGKSTLAKLLLRLYEPSSGEILVNGRSLSDLDHLSWRRRCGVVLQEGRLFNDSVAANIAAGVALNIARVKAVAEQVGAASFIETLPGTYEAILGADGVALSVGQKQRILIARALYGTPDLLILDEATSALDVTSEAQVMHAIEALAGQSTKIIIAHRLSTIVNADLIAVMDSGRIVERGTHAALMERGGAYRELVESQENAIA